MKELLKRLHEEQLRSDMQKCFDSMQGKGFSIYDITNEFFFKYGIQTLILLAGTIIFIIATTP